LRETVKPGRDRESAPVTRGLAGGPRAAFGCSLGVVAAPPRARGADPAAVFLGERRPGAGARVRVRLADRRL